MNKNMKDRRGEIGFNSYGSLMKIIEYINNSNITVCFDNGYVTKTTYQNFKIGFVVNPYDKTIFNVGYISEGAYSSKNNKDIYLTWITMMQRCYNEKYQQSRPTYKGCTVCKEWHNFQKFAQWYKENYYQINGERMALDKDILFKGNKIYSSDTCVIVPTRINSLFVKADRIRGNYPIGVIFIENKDYYKSQCRNGKEKICLGYYNTVLEAFEVYKTYKETLIKQVADQYKDQIPDKLYQALYSYKVEITD